MCPVNKPETRSARAPTGPWMLSTRTRDMVMAVESWILTHHRQALTWRQKRNGGLHGEEDTNTSFCTGRTIHTIKSNRQSICRMRLSTSASEKKTTTLRSSDHMHHSTKTGKSSSQELLRPVYNVLSSRVDRAQQSG